MRIGLIGAGNMAGAMARGWGEPVVAYDPFPGRARELVDELGGTVAERAAEVAATADVVLLAFKPYQLDEVASELGTPKGEVVSILGATPVDRVRAALPGANVVRVLPNTPVEINRGVLVIAEESPPSAELRTLLERLGLVVDIPDRLIDVAMGAMSCGPAFFALVDEAIVDAAVRLGLTPEVANRLTAGTMEGTAALIAARGHDTLAVRRQVTSPGGSTARGLAALERGGVRGAFLDALDAVANP